MLRFTESIQISKDSITLKFTRVGYFDMGRVSVHTLHFLFHFIGSIGEINAVAQRFTHFCLSVRTRQPQTSSIVRQQDFRFYQRITINMIEPTDNFTRLLNHWFLIFTHRHGCSPECRDIGCLTNRNYASVFLFSP